MNITGLNTTGVKPIKDTYFGMAAVLVTAVLIAPMLAQMLADAVRVGDPGLYNALALLSQQVLFGLLAVWHLRMNLRLDWRDFGCGRISLHQAKVALATGLALVAVNGIGVWLSKAIWSAILGADRALALFDREDAVLMGLSRREQSYATLAVLLLAVIVVAPLVEELFFRGYLYAALKSKIGRHAVWVGSLLFTAVHLYVVHAIPVFLLALALTAMYEKNGRLWDNVLAHATLNGVVAATLLIQR